MIYKLFAVTMVAVCLTFSGCGTTSGNPPTKEAIVYFTLKDTWTAARTAYRGFKEQQVLGRVKPKDAADIDKAWNEFRNGLRVAVNAAQGNYNVPTPENVAKLKQHLLELILAL